MQKDKKAEINFWDHLVELMRRARIIAISVIITTVFVMLFPVTLDFASLASSNPFYQTPASLVINDFRARFLPPEAELLPMSPVAPLEVYMLISVVLGVVLSSPVIAYQLYKFLNPALYGHERKAVLQFVGSFVGLLVFGFALGYFLVLPLTMRTLLLFSTLLGLPPKYDFSEFLSIIGFSLFLCSFVFTFPTYVVLLVKAGILQIRTLSKNRKYLYGGLLVIIAIMDPDPGLVTEVLLFLPIVVLMEVTILFAKRIERNREDGSAKS